MNRATSKDAKNQSPPAASELRIVTPSLGLTSAEARARLIQYGANALEEKKQNILRILLAYFWGPIPWMIEAAAVMALLVRDWGDFAIITLLLVFNAGLGFWEEHAAADALEALKNALALRARALRDGTWAEVNARDLVPGDVISLYLGDVVPADCKLLKGDYLSVDQSALTGESLPVSKTPGNVAYSGSIIRQGEMTAVVTSTGANTFFGRTASLVAGAGAVSHFQKTVTTIGDTLIIMALVLAAVLVADRLYVMRDHFDRTGLLRLAELVLILLVASVPVAMPAVLSVTMALGARKLAQKKAIVSRLESIEELAGIDILCSDKTGTLTQNKLTLGQVLPWHGIDTQTLLLMGALASHTADNDPIDLAVIAGLTGNLYSTFLKSYQVDKYVPFDPVSKRSEATITDSNGKAWRVTKGAPQVVMNLAGLSPTDRSTAEQTVNKLAQSGHRTLAVARACGDEPWEFLGILPLSDPPRFDSKETIARAFAYGVKVKMVTGDNEAIAREISTELGIGCNILPATELFPGNIGTGQIPPDATARIERADGFAEVFPEHKFAIVKILQKAGHIVGMTGDGVNDAPALKQADVGIAVSGATAAARAAAALILTSPGLSVIIDGISEARRIFERMMSYVLYRIAMTIDIMAFVVLASVAYGFFPLTPIMIIALALLDDIPIMTIAFDNADIAPKPVHWQLHQVLFVSGILGLLAVVQSFALLYVGSTIYQLDRPQLQTMMFLQLVAGGHLMLFLTRARGPFWKSPHPNVLLFTAICATQIFAILMCGLGWLVPALSWKIIGWVWIYNLAWMLIQDVVKLGLYHHQKENSDARLR